MTADRPPPTSTLTLGSFLKKERERRRITLEQVASATKVSVKQLQSLESDQYSELPAKPFVRGFVVSYCRFIGLNPKDTLTQYGSFIDEKAQERPNREAGHSGYAFEKPDGGEDSSRMILAGVMGGFIVVGGLAFLFLKPTLHSGRHSHLDKLRGGSPAPLPSESVLPSPVSLPQEHFPKSKDGNATKYIEIASPLAAPTLPPSPKPSPTPKPQATTSPVPSPSPSSTVSDSLNSGLGLKPSETAHRLVVKAIESVWVRYKVDDKPPMQFPLRKDKILVLRAKKSIYFQTSDPENVQMSHNGGGYQPSSGFQAAPVGSDATFIFGIQPTETSAEPFPGQKPITHRPVPVSPTAIPQPKQP